MECAHCRSIPVILLLGLFMDYNSYTINSNGSTNWDFTAKLSHIKGDPGYAYHMTSALFYYSITWTHIPAGKYFINMVIPRKHVFLIIPTHKSYRYGLWTGYTFTNWNPHRIERGIPNFNISVLIECLRVLSTNPRRRFTALDLPHYNINIYIYLSTHLYIHHSHMLPQNQGRRVCRLCGAVVRRNNKQLENPCGNRNPQHKPK